MSNDTQETSISLIESQLSTWIHSSSDRDTVLPFRSCSVTICSSSLNGWVQQRSKACAAAAVSSAVNAVCGTRTFAQHDALDALRDIVVERYKTAQHKFKQCLGCVDSTDVVEWLESQLNKRNRSLAPKPPEENNLVPNSKVTIESLSPVDGVEAMEEYARGILLASSAVPHQEQLCKELEESIGHSQEGTEHCDVQGRTQVQFEETSGSTAVSQVDTVTEVPPDNAVTHSQEGSLLDNTRTQEGSLLDNTRTQESSLLDNTRTQDATEKQLGNSTQTTAQINSVPRFVLAIAKLIAENDKVLSLSTVRDDSDKAEDVNEDDVNEQVLVNINCFNWKKQFKSLINMFQGMRKLNDEGKPSTAIIGNWGIVSGIHLLSKDTVKCKIFMSAMPSQRSKRAEPSNMLPVVIQKSDNAENECFQWSLLCSYLTSPNTCLIYHLKNHFALVFAARSWQDQEGLHRQILTARKGQGPKCWIDWFDVRSTLLKWKGYCILVAQPST